MRKKCKWLIQMMLIISIFILFPNMANAAEEPLDEIELYQINIDMLPDGRATITYHLEWKVLDSKTEGPLEDLYIGIPNKHAENFTALSDNISQIEYTNNYNGKSGSYVHLKFYRSYYEGEIFEFDFSIEQGYLYILNDDETVEFGFTPGWFPDTPINNLVVYWNGNYVLESNCQSTDENNRLVWKTSLPSGKSEQLSMSVTYNQSRFESLDSDKESRDLEEDAEELIITIIVIIIIIIIVLILFCGDGYSGGGGVFISGGYSSGCASCASSCACACACAGGGRAGCSTKNFYAVIKQKDLKNAFKKCKSS